MVSGGKKHPLNPLSTPYFVSFLCRELSLVPLRQDSSLNVIDDDKAFALTFKET